MMNSYRHVFISACDLIFLDDIYIYMTVIIGISTVVRDLKDKFLKERTYPLDYFGGQLEGVDP